MSNTRWPFSSSVIRRLSYPTFSLTLSIHAVNAISPQKYSSLTRVVDKSNQGPLPFTGRTVTWRMWSSIQQGQSTLGAEAFEPNFPVTGSAVTCSVRWAPDLRGCFNWSISHQQIRSFDQRLREMLSKATCYFDLGQCPQRNRGLRQTVSVVAGGFGTTVVCSKPGISISYFHIVFLFRDDSSKVRFLLRFMQNI